MCLFVYVYTGCFPCLPSKAMPSGVCARWMSSQASLAHAGEFLSRMATALWHSLFMAAFFPKVSHRNRNRRGIRRFLSHRHQSPFINPNMAKRPVFHSRKRVILFSEWRRRKKKKNEHLTLSHQVRFKDHWGPWMRSDKKFSAQMLRPSTKKVQKTPCLTVQFYCASQTRSEKWKVNSNNVKGMLLAFSAFHCMCWK